MFDNIGKKIKGVSMALCCIGIFLFCIYGLIYWINAAQDQKGVLGFFTGLGISIGGSLASWIASFAAYALGELMENTVRIRENTDMLLGKKGLYRPNSSNPEMTKAEKPANEYEINIIKKGKSYVGKCVRCQRSGILVTMCEYKILGDSSTDHYGTLCENCQKKYSSPYNQSH